MAAVTFIRTELARVMGQYALIRDCLSGSEAVKAAGALYLPMPNSTDKSPENKARYAAYIRRARFYNVARRTLQGLTGQVFARDPVSEIPNSMDAIELDATGTGVSLVQQAKRALNYSLAYSRGGLLVDYPNTDGVGATKKEIDDGHARPTMQVYEPRSVINWRTTQIGAKTVLSMVAIAETWPFHDDGFEVKHACQVRVLRLEGAPENDGERLNIRNGHNLRYKVSIYREAAGQETKWDGSTNPPKDKHFNIAEEFYPTDASGAFLDEIPFTFFGAENNDTSVDLPALYDLCDLNIGHYCNSADYEEACYVLGQPTYYISGLTESWLKNTLGGKIQLGSWGGIPLPENASAGILQPEPNTMVFEAMQHKERQMVALGAKLVEDKKVQRTATEADNDKSAESSYLAAAAKNVSAAFEWALKQCSIFMGTENEKIVYQLNTDFDLMKLTPEERKALIAEWQAGAITFGEMRNGLRRAAVATEDDEVAKKQIAEEQAEAVAVAAKEMQTMNEASGLNDPANVANRKPPAKPVKDTK